MNWLKREELKALFHKRPNFRIAQAYLQSLMRDRHGGAIGDEEYLDGLDEIKTWMKEGK